MASETRIPVVSSPDGALTATVTVADGNLSYAIGRDGNTLVAASPFSIRNSTEHTVTGHTTTSHDSSWAPTWGQYSRIRDHHNRLTVNLDVGDIAFDLIVQVYDDGLGFRFVANEQPSMTGTTLNYNVRYNMDATYLARWPDGEHSPVGPHAIGSLDGVSLSPTTPVVINAGANGYFALMESDLYSAEAFASIRFDAVSGEPAIDANMESQAVPAGDFVSPWRVVLVGDTPGDLLESTVAMNLAAPLALDDASWVKPGKALFNWRIDGYQTDDGFTYGQTTASQKRLIDFAAENGFTYVQVDDGWFTNITDGHLVTERRGFDVDEVIEYAASKGVDVILYIDRKRGRVVDTTDAQIFELYSGLGAAGAKYGFHGGDASFTRAALRDTAARELVINFHDDPVPMTGARRTMPNAITRQTG